MEDLIYFRRQRSSGGQFQGNQTPLIRLDLKRGQFVIYNKVAELIKAKGKDAVMFAFNKKDKCGYIFKENPEIDSYYLTGGSRSYYRFTSKQLSDFFVDFFGINKEKAVYFELEKTPNEKGMFKFKPKNF
jgi:hypothetical protein